MPQRSLMVRGLFLDEVHLFGILVIILWLDLHVLAAHDRVSTGCFLCVLREKRHSIGHR